MLKNIELFKIRKENKACFLFHDQKEVRVEGGIIECQYKFLKRFVIILSDDIYFERGLHIYVLDDALNVLDYIEISSGYATDLFEMKSILLPNRIRFTFLLDKEFWELSVLEKPRTVFCLLNHLVRRKKIFFNKIYMELTKRPILKT